MERPALASAFLLEGTGPVPMIEGSTPASAPETMVASGVMPSSWAFFSLMTTRAAAPSLMAEELPAVTMPSGLKAGRSFASVSTVDPSRGPSSVSKTISFLRCLTVTGTISSLKAPSAMALQVWF